MRLAYTGQMAALAQEIANKTINLAKEKNKRVKAFHNNNRHLPPEHRETILPMIVKKRLTKSGWTLPVLEIDGNQKLELRTSNGKHIATISITALPDASYHSIDICSQPDD